MASEGGERYALGRLILDYLRSFTWPAILLAVVLFYSSDVREILRSRELEVVGFLKIGQKVEELEAQAAEEIADVRALLQELQARPDLPAEAVAADIDGKLTRLSSNLSREVQQIQQIAPDLASGAATAQVALTPRPAASVVDLEREGFEALLDRDAERALETFGRAEALVPNHNSVAAIRALLAEHRAELADPESRAWSKLYRVILTKHSWGMPSGFRPKFRRLAAAS
ncbi:MAG: hypothetical protein QNJ30_00630 [Kiloniellales bacterium]|nr:hypothetical protein [Kiloniellales bacterium]